MPDRSEASRATESSRSSADSNAPRAPRKDPAAVALGRKGGLKGGKARAAKLTPQRRSEIARKAAQARWQNPGT